MSFTAYTDYPIEDGTFETGVKEVQVLSYDRNKYCTVLRNGFEDEIKIGYIFLDPTLKHRPSKAIIYSLPSTPEDAPVTRHQLANEMKQLRRRKTTYRVLSSLQIADPKETNRRKDFKNYHDALRYSQTQCMLSNRDVALTKFVIHKNTSSSIPMMSCGPVDPAPVIYVGRGRRRRESSIKLRLYTKYFFSVWQHRLYTKAPC